MATVTGDNNRSPGKLPPSWVPWSDLGRHIVEFHGQDAAALLPKIAMILQRYARTMPFQFQLQIEHKERKAGPIQDWDPLNVDWETGDVEVRVAELLNFGNTDFGRITQWIGFYYGELRPSELEGLHGRICPLLVSTLLVDDAVRQATSQHRREMQLAAPRDPKGPDGVYELRHKWIADPTEQNAGHQPEMAPVTTSDPEPTPPASSVDNPKTAGLESGNPEPKDPEFDLNSKPPHLPRYTGKEKGFHQATSEEIDACFEDFSKSLGGTIPYKVLPWGRHWLRNKKQADTSDRAIQQRFDEEPNRHYHGAVGKRRNL
jgi:hypothetical protein